MDALTKLVMFVVSAAHPVTLASCCAAFPRRKASNVRAQLATLHRQGRIVSSASELLCADVRVVSCAPDYKTEAFRTAMVLGNVFLSIRPDLSDALKDTAKAIGPKRTCDLLQVLIACATNSVLTFGYTDQHGAQSFRRITEVGQVFQAKDGFCMWGHGVKADAEGEHEPTSRCFRVDRMSSISMVEGQGTPTGLAYPLVHTFGSKPITKEVWAQHPEGYVESGAILF